MQTEEEIEQPKRRKHRILDDDEEEQIEEEPQQQQEQVQRIRAHFIDDEATETRPVVSPLDKIADELEAFKSKMRFQTQAQTARIFTKAIAI